MRVKRRRVKKRRVKKWRGREKEESIGYDACKTLLTVGPPTLICYIGCEIEQRVGKKVEGMQGRSWTWTLEIGQKRFLQHLIDSVAKVELVQQDWWGGSERGPPMRRRRMSNIIIEQMHWTRKTHSFLFYASSLQSAL